MKCKTGCGRRILKGTCFDEGFPQAFVLLARLENEAYGSCQFFTDFIQQPCRSKQNRGMGVMTARVDYSRGNGFPGYITPFLNR